MLKKKKKKEKGMAFAMFILITITNRHVLSGHIPNPLQNSFAIHANTETKRLK